MDIGTAKPSFEKRLKIPHYLINIIFPNQEFTVAQFKEKALQIIQEIQDKYRIPFLVGGTGLYIKTLVDNLNIPKVAPDKKLRSKLEKEIEKKGLESLWEKLIKLDPKAAEFIQRKNPRRIIRALEVCLKTKKPFSELRNKKDPLFECLELGLKISKKEIKERISKRVDKMMEIGLIEEVKALKEKYTADSCGLRTIGYQEIISYLKGEIDLEEAIDLIKKNTWQYAKRQMTWFKKNKNIKWIENYEEAEELVKEFLIDLPL